MQFDKNYAPRIPYPQSFARAHVALSPLGAQVAAARATSLATEAGRSTWAGCYHTARKDAHWVLGGTYGAINVVFGSASPKSYGLLERAAHGLSAVAAGVLSGPTWLCRNVEVSVYVYQRIKELFLVALALPCLISALGGLALKAVLTAGVYAPIFAASFLLNACHTPSASQIPGLAPVPMQPLA